MNIYIDFEANGISQLQEIISIGAVTENGDNFYSLIRPHAKLDHKIKEFTHISQEEADVAPSLEEVAENFKKWLSTVSATGASFLVYGNSDGDFLQSSMALTEDENAKSVLQNIYDNIKRVDTQIAKKFRRKTIGLRSAYLTMRLSSNEAVEQQHNALEDAEMLKYVWEHINEYELPDGVTPIKVPQMDMRYGKKKKKKVVATPEPSKKHSRYRSRKAYRRWVKRCIAQCPEILDEKFIIPVKATKGSRQPIFFENLRQAMSIAATEHGFVDGYDKLAALNILYDAVQTGKKVNGWLIERVEESEGK